MQDQRPLFGLYEARVDEVLAEREGEKVQAITGIMGFGVEDGCVAGLGEGGEALEGYCEGGKT